MEDINILKYELVRMCLNDAIQNEESNPKFAFENYSEAIKWLLQMVETNYYQGEQRKIVLEKINSYLNKLEYLKENNDLKNKK